MRPPALIRVLGAAAALCVSPLASATPVTGYVFQDDFEGPLSWGAFEEVVAGDACAGASRRPDLVVSSTGAQRHGGASSLQVFTNPLDTPVLTSHVLGQKEIFAAGQGGHWKYAVYVYVDASTIGLTQTGPEISLQNTRQIALGTWRTMTAGLQYVGNQWVSNKWSVWAAIGSGPSPSSETAGWVSVAGPTLTETGWYLLSMEVDYDQNQYIALSVVTPSGSSLLLQPQNSSIAREVKFSEPAFWATLEGQNLWDCVSGGSAWQSHVYYDDVTLSQTQGQLYRLPTATYTTPSTGMGQPVTFPAPATDPDGDIDWSSLTITVSPSHGTVTVDPATGNITYAPTPGFAGGDGFKFRVCDRTLLCAEAWVGMSVVNHPPVATNTAVATGIDVPVTIALPIVDQDGNLDFSTTTELVVPSNGSTIYDRSGGTVTYTPASGVSGSTGFKFRVCDTYAACAEAWISVMIQ